jgi:hypothetical protein
LVPLTCDFLPCTASACNIRGRIQGITATARRVNQGG